MLFYLVIFQTHKQARQNVITFHLQTKRLRLENIKGLSQSTQQSFIGTRNRLLIMSWNIVHLCITAANSLKYSFSNYNRLSFTALESTSVTIYLFQMLFALVF